jgi:hypothetical protein
MNEDDRGLVGGELSTSNEHILVVRGRSNKGDWSYLVELLERLSIGRIDWCANEGHHQQYVNYRDITR